MLEAVEADHRLHVGAIRLSSAGAEVFMTTSAPSLSRKRARDSENACSIAGPDASTGIDSPLALVRPGIRPCARNEWSTDAMVVALGANRLTNSPGVKYWRYCREAGSLTARA